MSALSKARSFFAFAGVVLGAAVILVGGAIACALLVGVVW